MNLLAIGSKITIRKICEEIIDKVKKENYQINFPDLELLTMRISRKTRYRFGIILISQVGNLQKKNEIRFCSTPGLNSMDKGSAPILSFHHTFYEGEHILSSILSEYEGELRFDTTIENLYSKNEKHKLWIKI